MPDTREGAESAILRALADAATGLSRADVQRRAGLSDVPAAKVLRWLNELVERGLVRAEGATRSRRYRIGGAAQQATAPAQEPELPSSPEGEAVRRQVSRPLGSRQPTSYVRAFLDAYRPNETFYLPGATRQHLMALGKTTATPQPGGTYARQILQRLLIELSWNSSRLEGNTYSLLDTERLIVEGTSAAGKDPTERQMIINHKAAIEWIVEEAGNPGSLRFNARLMRNLHALLMENLLADPAEGGRVRARPVLIRSSTFIPLAVPQQVEECLTQVALVADAIADPFEQSFFLLVHVPYLQPFIDGNKRTARLAANVPLVRDNLRPLTFVDVPERSFIDAVLGVYELRKIELLRDVFVWAYERSSARYAAVQESVGQPDPFRLAHRALIKEAVAALVREGRGAEELEGAIEIHAERLPAAERPRFVAVVEAELRGLHEGNYARYRLRPAELEAWEQRTRGGEGG